MVTKKIELEILNLYQENIDMSYDVSQVKDKLGRYLSQVQLGIKLLLKKKAIKIKESNNKSKFYKIDLENINKDLLFESSIYRINNINKNHKKLQLVQEEISKNLPLFSIFILFGSFAKNTSKNNSDIDICILVDNENNIEFLERKINYILSGFNYKIDLNILSIKEFKDLKNKKGTIGNEIFKSGVPIYGIDSYYRIIKDND